MTRRSPVFTEPADCLDCYRCVRVCPVKSVRVEGGSASVVAEECVACGFCVMECPHGHQRIRSDVERVHQLLVAKERVIVSLSSTWASEFPGVPYSSLIQALRALGFDEISELGLGAEIMARECAHYVASQGPGVMIIPACPAVTNYIQREWSHWAGNLIPTASPLISHARLLKATLGEEVRIVGIGPCVAQKLEADEHPELVSAVITFGELHSWMLDRGIHPSHYAENEIITHVPYEAQRGHRHTIARGILYDIEAAMPKEENVEWLYYSGIERVREALTGLETWSDGTRLVMEFLGCAGGCVHGPGASRLQSLTQRQMAVIKTYPVSEKREWLERKLPADFSVRYESKREEICALFSPLELSEQLAKVGIYSAQDQTNCGCCGYATCQQFAIAMCNGRAESGMCVPYQRKVAEGKFDVLLNHMPSGVVVVDSNLRIIEANWNAAHMLGPAVELAFDRHPGLSGLEAERYIPFHRHFSNVLRSGEQLLSRDERVGSHLLRVSVFTIQSHELVCAIIRNMYASDVRSDEIVRRSNALITKNLETVQKIAYLLGENASETESELNAIVESFRGEAGYAE